MYIRVEALEDGKIAIRANVPSHFAALRLLAVASQRFLDAAEQGSKKTESVTPDTASRLREALEINAHLTGPRDGWLLNLQLLNVLATFLMIDGVLADAGDGAQEIAEQTIRALSAESEFAACDVMPCRDTLTALLHVTRLKRTRGRIAMAKGGDAVTPQDVLVELRQMRQEWRTMLKDGYDSEYAAADEEAE